MSPWIRVVDGQRLVAAIERLFGEFADGRVRIQVEQVHVS